MSQVIPTKYASTLEHRDGVSPAKASGMFEADGVSEACTDVLAWLRVTCTVCSGAGDLAGTPAAAQPFTLLLLPTAFCEYVVGKVLNDLPGRRGPRLATAAHFRCL